MLNLEKRISFLSDATVPYIVTRCLAMAQHGQVTYFKLSLCHHGVHATLLDHGPERSVVKIVDVTCECAGSAAASHDYGKGHEAHSLPASN